MDIKCYKTVVLVALASLGVAQAQTLPDAGSLRQQIERERPLPLPPPQVPAAPAGPAPQETSPNMAVVKVKEFRFAGNTLLSDAQLLPAVRDYLGRDLSFNDLQKAAQAVAEQYRQAGWIVRTFLPRQDVTAGIVTIQIEEARFGAARLEGEPPKRLMPEQWRAIVSAAQPEGEPVSAAALDRALLLLDDLPGVTAAGSLMPGQQAGQTDLLLQLKDEPLFAGAVSADNAGSRSIGRGRMTGSLGVNSPLRRGDKLWAHLIHTQGSDYGRLAYNLPVGATGLRVGANVSHMKYRLVPDQFAALDAKGSFTSYGLEASYPLLRSRLKNLYLSASLDNRRFDNEANDATTSRYDANVAGLGLIGNRYDQFGGGGVTEASLFVNTGKILLKGDTGPRTDRSDGRFTKLRWSLSRQQALTGDLSAVLSWSGQWADRNLDSSERFYLGGPYGVRAYPVNEGGGSAGQLLSFELRHRIGGAWQLSGFFDYGHVRQYVNNSDAAGRSLTAPVSNRLDYKGVGLSLGWQGPYSSQFKLTWARRLGSNPNPALNGQDQDGSLDKNRVWLSLSIPFEFGPAARPAVSSRP